MKISSSTKLKIFVIPIILSSLILYVVDLVKKKVHNINKVIWVKIC